MSGSDNTTTTTMQAITKFDGSDFAFWRMQIEDYLYSKKLHVPLLGSQPDDMEDDEWELIDRQVLGVIRLTLSKNVAHNVATAKTTAGLMKVLSDMYEKPSANNKLFLMKKLFNLKMQEGASVVDHMNSFNTVFNQLAAMGIKFEDEVCALILLASLPNTWESMRAAVTNSIGSTKLTFVSIRDAILVEEVRRRDSVESSNSALNVERGRSSSQGNGRNNRRSKSRSGRPSGCWNFCKLGHYARNCTAPKKDGEGDSANVATEKYADALILSVNSSSDSWMIYSGASFNENEIFYSEFISSPPPLLRSLDLSCRLRDFPDWISKLQNLHRLILCNSRLMDEPLKYLKGLPNLETLVLVKAYEGEELRFEEGGFQKLWLLELQSLEGLKVLKIERGALPLLKRLHIGPFPMMKEMPCDIQHLSNLESLNLTDMTKEFVNSLQPDQGNDYWKIQHIPSVNFWYKNRGQYDWYNLGSSELLQRL